jgi:hypothetical protein
MIMLMLLILILIKTFNAQRSTFNFQRLTAESVASDC